MSSALPYFPSALLPEGAVQFDLFGMVLGGGQTAGGTVPLARLDGGGLWKATLADIPIKTREQVLAWRALAAICDGGVAPIVVTKCDARFMPAPLDQNGKRIASYPDVLHAGDA